MALGSNHVQKKKRSSSLRSLFKYPVRCSSYGATNRVRLHSVNRKPLCGNQSCRSALVEPIYIRLVGRTEASAQYIYKSVTAKLLLSAGLITLGVYIPNTSELLSSTSFISGTALLLLSFGQLEGKQAARAAREQFERAKQDFEEATPSNIPLVQSYLDDLLNSIGGAIPAVNSEVLLGLHKRGEFAKMLGWIKNAMRVDCKVGLKVVDKLAPGNPMRIHYSKPMPMIGTDEFKKLRVVVHATKEILLSQPFEWVVAGFAHELSHVVLSSLSHRLQEEEKAVDLTAMILGFEDFVACAWSVTLTNSSSFSSQSLGYLSIPEREFARTYLKQRRRG